MKQQRVTLMFHSVGLDRWEWCSVGVAEPLGLFEQTMEALRRGGYSTAFFASPPDSGAWSRKELALTFDDGYLDNWVHVFPILRKHGFKATIFVSPDFVDPRDIVRPQVEPGTVSDREHSPETCCAGFLSWPELRAMQDSGLVDIQSHCMTHTWLCSGPRVVDFWHPGIATEDTSKSGVSSIWLLWNRFPEFKPFYLTQAREYETRIPYGTPIYEHGRALATRQFFPDGDLQEILTQHVESNGGLSFFKRNDWRMELRQVMARHDQARPEGAGRGRWESESEYLERARWELAESKRILEGKLHKPVEAVCWPGGGVNERVLEIAREVGYRHYTLPTCWAVDQATGRYRDLTPRMGGGRLIRYSDGVRGVRSVREFIWVLEYLRGSMVCKWLGRGAILARLACRRLRRP